MTSRTPMPDAPPQSERELIDVALSTLRQLLPDDWLIESAPVDGPPSQWFDASYILTAPDGARASVGVEARRLVEPRDVANLRDIVLQSNPSTAVDIPIVAARYLSRPVQERLAAAGLSFIDATGNTLVRSRRPALHIGERGADQDPWRGPGRPRGTLKGEPAAKVVRALVDFPSSWSVRELVGVSGASTGSVYRVLEFLESEGLVAREADGQWLADDWRALLRRWSVDYQFSSASRVSRWIAVRGIDTFLDSVRRSDVGNYVLTGSVAAGAWAPYAPARLASVYVDDRCRRGTAMGSASDRLRRERTARRATVRSGAGTLGRSVGRPAHRRAHSGRNRSHVRTGPCAFRGGSPHGVDGAQ